MADAKLPTFRRDKTIMPFRDMGFGKGGRFYVFRAPKGTWLCMFFHVQFGDLIFAHLVLSVASSVLPLVVQGRKAWVQVRF